MLTQDDFVSERAHREYQAEKLIRKYALVQMRINALRKKKNYLVIYFTIITLPAVLYCEYDTTPPFILIAVVFLFLSQFFGFYRKNKAEKNLTTEASALRDGIKALNRHFYFTPERLRQLGEEQYDPSEA